VTAVAIATWVALHPLAYFLLARIDREPASRARVVLAAYVTVLGALPFQIASGALFWRAAAATIAVSYSVKAFELTRGKVRDASILHNFWRFLLWMMVPHDPRWPETAQLRVQSQARGLRFVGRALLKLTVGLAVTAVARLVPPEHWPFLVTALATAVQFYCFATAISDLVGTIALFAGCNVDEIFITPYLARSPAEFWSRKWNLFIARFGARYIFFPWRRLGVTWASFLVFGASAVMHEYIVLAIFGSSAKLGYMSAFFGVQWFGVVAQHAWLRATRGKVHLRDGLSIALHLIWFVPTTVLFFEPIGVFLNQWFMVWQPIPW